jgi:hypothetical protein
MEIAHPNPSRPSPPMPAASPTLLDTKVATATGLAEVATTHIPFELTFESIGLRTRQRSHASAQITMNPIGNLASGLKLKRPAPPRKANKGDTKKGATKKGSKDVASKK